jgi:hypothetical protein
MNRAHGASRISHHRKTLRNQARASILDFCTKKSSCARSQRPQKDNPWLRKSLGDKHPFQAAPNNAKRNPFALREDSFSPSETTTLYG